MSLWEFGEFETDIDLTDVDTSEALDNAYEKITEEFQKVPSEGKTSEILKQQIKCFSVFFDTLFGEGTSEKISGGKKSLGIYIEAADSFYAFIEKENQKFGEIYSKYDKYRVQNSGNRQQRRNQKYRNKNKYGRR